MATKATKATQDQHLLDGPIRLGFRAPNADDLEAIQQGWETAVPHDPLVTFAISLNGLVLPSKKEGFSQVATLDDRIIGFASVINGALRAIYVEESYRRQGIGDKLLETVIQFAKTKKWKRLSVATSHHWVGTMSGLDNHYEETIRFLAQRGFKSGELIPDVEAYFEDLEITSRQHPLERVCTVTAYHPDALEEMKAFDKRVETQWSWVEWIKQYPQTDPKRVRLVAWVEGLLVGCIDALISPSGVAGLSYLYVDTAYRHRGIGSALLRDIAAECKKRGASSMYAGMARRELYLANGWRVQREFLSMTKPLKT
jgi:GNAT superfamily N-acetyltransferase